MVSCRKRFCFPFFPSPRQFSVLHAQFPRCSSCTREACPPCNVARLARARPVLPATLPVLHARGLSSLQLPPWAPIPPVGLSYCTRGARPPCKPPVSRRPRLEARCSAATRSSRSVENRFSSVASRSPLLRRHKIKSVRRKSVSFLPRAPQQTPCGCLHDRIVRLTVSTAHLGLVSKIAAPPPQVQVGQSKIAHLGLVSKIAAPPPQDQDG